MNEHQFKGKVSKYLKSLKCYFITSPYNLTRGIPDFIIVYKGYAIGIELKVDDGIVTEIQKYNLIEIKESGGHSFALRYRLIRDLDTYELTYYNTNSSVTFYDLKSLMNEVLKCISGIRSDIKT